MVVTESELETAYSGDDGEVRRAGAAVERRRRRQRRLLVVVVVVDDHDLGRLGFHLASGRQGLVGEAGVRQSGVARRAVVLHEHLVPAPRPARRSTSSRSHQTDEWARRRRCGGVEVRGRAAGALARAYPSCGDHG